MTELTYNLLLTMTYINAFIVVCAVVCYPFTQRIPSLGAQEFGVAFTRATVFRCGLLTIALALVTIFVEVDNPFLLYSN